MGHGEADTRNGCRRRLLGLVSVAALVGGPLGGLGAAGLGVLLMVRGAWCWGALVVCAGALLAAVVHFLGLSGLFERERERESERGAGRRAGAAPDAPEEAPESTRPVVPDAPVAPATAARAGRCVLGALLGLAGVLLLVGSVGYAFTRAAGGAEGAAALTAVVGLAGAAAVLLCAIGALSPPDVTPGHYDHRVVPEGQEQG